MIRIPRFDDTLIILGIFILNNSIATELQIIISILQSKRKKAGNKASFKRKQSNSRKDI